MSSPIEKLHFELTADSSSLEKSIQSCLKQIESIDKALIKSVEKARIDDSYNFKDIEKAYNSFKNAVVKGGGDIDKVLVGQNVKLSEWVKATTSARKEYANLVKVSGGGGAAQDITKSFLLSEQAMAKAKGSLDVLKQKEAERLETAKKQKDELLKQAEITRQAAVQARENEKAQKEKLKAEKAKTAEFEKQAKVIERLKQKETGIKSQIADKTIASGAPVGFSDISKNIDFINKKYRELSLVSKTSLGAAQKEVDAFNAKLKKLGIELNEIQKGSGSFSQAKWGTVALHASKEYNELKNKIGGTKQEVIDFINKEEKLAAELQKNTLLLANQSKAFVSMTSGITTAKDKLAVFNNSLGQYSQWEQGIGQLNKLSSSLWVVSMGMKQFGQSLTYGVTLPLAATGFGAIKFASDFELANAQIQAATEVSKEFSTSFQTGLGDKIKALSTIMPESIKNLQEYAYAASQAGIADAFEKPEDKINALIKYTSVIAKLKAVEKDYRGGAGELAELLARITYSYKMSTDDVENVASAIREASAAIPGGLSELQAALTRAAATAGTFNISFDKTLGLLMTLLPVTAIASRAGTQMSNIYGKMAQNIGEAFTNTKDTVTGLEEIMGVSAKTIEAQLNSNAELFFISLVEKFSKYEGAVSKSNLLMEIFGEDTKKVVEQIINNFDKLENNVNRATEAFREGSRLTEDYEIVAATFSATMQKIRNMLQIVATEIGDDIVSAISNLADKFIYLLGVAVAVWRAMGDGTKKFAIILAGVAMLLGPIVLIFEKVFVSLIAGSVTSMAKIGQLTITTGLLERAALRAGIAQTFLATSTTNVGKAAAGTGVLGLLKMSYAAKGLHGIFMALLPILGRIALAFGAIGAVVAVVAVAINKNLFGIKDKMKSFTDKFGFTGLSDQLNEQLSSIQEYKDEITKANDDAMNLMSEQATGAGQKMVKIFGSWGDAFVEKYIKRFSDLDSQTMGQGLSIAKQVFQEQEQMGEITVKRMYELGETARKLVAKAILDVKEAGKVGKETSAGLIGLIGGDRVDSIVKAIKATVKVDEIQSALDDASSSLKQLQDAFKTATDNIQKQIDSAKKDFDIASAPLERMIKDYEKQIKALQKARDNELKPLEEKRKTEEKVLKEAKDQLDAVKKQNKAELSVYEKQKKEAENQLKDSKKILDELKNLRKAELEVVEGMVRYQEMNFDAAKDQLALETAMGRDEFYITYRMAKARAEQSKDQLELARNQAARLESIYNKEIEAQELIVESQQDLVDSIQEQIDVIKEANDAIEATYQEQVDIMQEALDNTKDAIDEIKEKWDEQISVLQERLDAEKETLELMKEAHNEYLAVLEDEKNALSEKYEKEIEIEQAKVDMAQNSLEAAQKSLDRINKINQELLAMEAERIGAQTGPGDKSGAGAAAAKATADDGVPGSSLRDAHENNLAEMDKRIEEKRKKLEDDEAGKTEWQKTNEEVAAGYKRMWSEFKASVKEGMTEVSKKYEEYEKYPVLKRGRILKADEAYEKMPEYSKILSDGKKPSDFLTDDGNLDFSKILEEIQTKTDGFGTYIEEKFGLIKSNIISSAQASSEGVGDEFGKIDNSVRENTTSAYENVRGKFDNISTQISEKVELSRESVSAKFGDIKDKILGVNTDAEGNTTTRFSNIKEGIEKFAGKASVAVKDKWSEIKAKILGDNEETETDTSLSWEGIKTSISDVASSLWTNVKEKFSDFKEKVKTFFSGIPDAVKESLSNLGDVIFDAFKDGFGKLKTKGKELFSGFGDGVKDALSKVGFEFSSGGIVPGNFSQAVPITAHGSEMILNPQQQKNLFDLLAGKTSVNTGQVQGSVTNYNINPGMMIASKGEIRQFARLVAQYMEVENSRIN